jgi:hypothetical protein
LLHQKERAANVGRKQVVKILDRMIRDERPLADSGVEHNYIQSIADDSAHLFRQQRSSVWDSQICRNCICAAAFGLDLGDEGFRVLRGPAMVNQYVCPALASAAAVARPIPLDVPVTSAVLFCSVVIATSINR